MSFGRRMMDQSSDAQYARQRARIAVGFRRDHISTCRIKKIEGPWASAADCLHAGLRKPKMSDLALGYEVPHRPGDLLDRDVAVAPVLIEEIDVVRCRAA